MSLINQMLQDLEKRGEDHRPESESASRYAQYGSEVGERKQGLRFLLWGCLFLVLAYWAYFAFYRSSSTLSKVKEDTKSAVQVDNVHQVPPVKNADEELLKTTSLPLLLKMSTKIDDVKVPLLVSADAETNTVIEQPKTKASIEPSHEAMSSEQISKQSSAGSRENRLERSLPVVAEIKRTDGTAVDLSAVSKQTVEASSKTEGKRANGVAEQKSNSTTEKSNQSSVTVVKEISPQQRAEGEFKQATIYQQQGRNSEAVLALEQALKLDQNHAPARQLMISILLEAKRYDDAIRELRAGLNIDTHQINFAMILARLLVERAKVNEAVDILQKSAVYAQERPDYLAFMAALQQKLGRHKDAIQSYRLALAQHKQNPVWWMGIGISLQTEGANADALESYRQAKIQPGLGADLLAFVDQKIAQIQK